MAGAGIRAPRRSRRTGSPLCCNIRVPPKGVASGVRRPEGKEGGEGTRRGHDRMEWAARSLGRTDLSAETGCRGSCLQVTVPAHGGLTEASCDPEAGSEDPVCPSSRWNRDHQTRQKGADADSAGNHSHPFQPTSSVGPPRNLAPVIASVGHMLHGWFVNPYVEDVSGESASGNGQHERRRGHLMVLLRGVLDLDAHSVGTGGQFSAR